MSSVSGVSSLLNQYQANWQNNRSQLKQDFSDLMTSLQSGNLTGAQTAFSALTQSTSAISQTQTTQQSGTTGIQADFAALGQALQSGDMAAAQTDFAKLQQDLQGAHGHHHHHHHHQTQGTGDQNTPITMDPFQNTSGLNANKSNALSLGSINITA